MELPRDYSDICIAFACSTCNGNGGFGSRTREGGNPHQPCTTCNGTGWTIKRPRDLKPHELAKLKSKLPRQE